MLSDAHFKDGDDRKRFGDRVTAGVHCLSVIYCCFAVLLNPEESAFIDSDHLYGHSDGVAYLFALTTGYFLWDIYTCLTKVGFELS